MKIIELTVHMNYFNISKTSIYSIEHNKKSVLVELSFRLQYLSFPSN